MSILFEPFQLGTTTLKNRFVRSATFEGLCTVDGLYNDKAIQVYERLAQGRVGLIITGFTAVAPNGRAMPCMAMAADDNALPGLETLVKRVHQHGSRIALQLVHCGRNSLPMEGAEDIVAPSAVPCFHTGMTPRSLSAEEIHGLVEQFVLGAKLARKAGFDSLQLHAAHGYLFSQFLSPYTNLREDEYGGPLENRARFLLETTAAVKYALGPEIPLLVKLNSEDCVDSGGLTLEEACRVAEMLESAEIDGLETSGGTWDNKKGNMSIRKGVPKRYPEAYYADNARIIKSGLGIPVFLVGGIRSFEVAERVVQEETADLISLCRPLIHEPRLIARWQEGDRSPSGCISCNKCLSYTISPGGKFGCYKTIDN